MAQDIKKCTYSIRKKENKTERSIRMSVAAFLHCKIREKGKQHDGGRRLVGVKPEGPGVGREEKEDRKKKDNLPLPKQSQICTNSINNIQHLLWPHKQPPRLRTRHIRRRRAHTPQPLRPPPPIPSQQLPLHPQHQTPLATATRSQIQLSPPRSPIISITTTVFPFGPSGSNLEIPDPAPRPIIPLVD